MSFAILGQMLVAADWDGSPLVLARHESVNMPQTPAGSLVLAWLNVASMNNLGQLAITSGGSAPEFLAAPALSLQPGVLIRNWGGSNLNVSNTSPADQTPIRIQAIGPGIPGGNPLKLPNDGTNLSLAPGANAQGQTLPRYMQMTIVNHSGDLSVVAVIGGPPDASGNNACLIAVNASANTGKGSGSTAAPPSGYCATVTSNSYALNFNWGSSVIFVSNLSGSSASPTAIGLFPL